MPIFFFSEHETSDSDSDTDERIFDGLSAWFSASVSADIRNKWG